YTVTPLARSCSTTHPLRVSTATPMPPPRRRIRSRNDAHPSPDSSKRNFSMTAPLRSTTTTSWCSHAQSRAAKRVRSAKACGAVGVRCGPLVEVCDLRSRRAGRLLPVELIRDPRGDDVLSDLATDALSRSGDLLKNVRRSPGVDRGREVAWTVGESVRR